MLDVAQSCAEDTNAYGSPSSALPVHASHNNSSLARAVALGRQVYEALPQRARDDLHRRRKKPESFRGLAKNHGVPASTLWRAIAIFLVYQRHPELASYAHLGVGHLSVLVAVEPNAQLYFLRIAERARWSRRRLEREVKRWRSAARSPDGRGYSPPIGIALVMSKRVEPALFAH